MTTDPEAWKVEDFSLEPFDWVHESTLKSSSVSELSCLKGPPVLPIRHQQQTLGVQNPMDFWIKRMTYQGGCQWFTNTPQVSVVRPTDWNFFSLELSASLGFQFSPTNSITQKKEKNLRTQTPKCKAALTNVTMDTGITFMNAGMSRELWAFRLIRTVLVTKKKSFVHFLNNCIERLLETARFLIQSWWGNSANDMELTETTVNTFFFSTSLLDRFVAFFWILTIQIKMKTQTHITSLTQWSFCNASFSDPSSENEG